MHIEKGELQKAIAATERARGGNIEVALAEGFLTKLGEKKDRMLFGEALRYSLNESFIKEKSKRGLYACLAGKFYGRHGNAVQRANRAQGGTVRRKPRTKAAAVEFIDQPNGQRAFVI